MQMIFKLTEDNSLFSVPQLSKASIKLEEKKIQNFLSSRNLFTLSNLKSKEFVKKVFVQKVSRLMHAWFTLKGNVKRIRCYPVKELILFAVKLVLCR